MSSDERTLEIVRLVVDASVAERFVVVALVEVLLITLRECIVEDAWEIKPPSKVRSVDVAFEGNGSAPPPPPAPQAVPVPETVPEPFICKHCVDPLPSPEIVRLVVDAMPETERLVVVALVDVLFIVVSELIVEDALMMIPMVEVGTNASPTIFQSLYVEANVSSDVLDTLLLKTFQCALVRYPSVEASACVIERVLPLNESGADTVVAATAPPLLVESMAFATFEIYNAVVDAIPVTVRLVLVALVVDAADAWKVPGKIT